MVKRRKVLFGIGSIAAGGAAATATGAFSSAQMNRDADIDVVDDTNGLIALVPGEGADGRVYLESGELKIDFTSSEGGDGVNPNARYQVGGWNTAGGMNYTDVDESDVLEGYPAGGQPPAFQIINQDDADHDISAEYSVADSDDVGEASLHFQFVPQGGQSNANKQGIDIDDDNPTDSFSGQDTPTGHNWAVSLLVDTRGVIQDSENLDLSGTLTISAD